MELVDNEVNRLILGCSTMSCLLLTGNPYPQAPYPPVHWWMWVAVGVFVVVWFFVYFVRRRR